MKKQIRGYDYYYIYDNGDIYNSRTQKLLKGTITQHGYLTYRLSKNNKKHSVYAHRLVAEYFLPNPNNYPVVNHKDGNKLNNDISNLEWTTYSDNTKQWHDMSKAKRQPYEKYNGDLPNEQWVVIPNHNYRCSSYGRVHNLKTNNLLHPVVTCGYYKVRLSTNGHVDDFLVHHLVYQLFNNDFKIKDNEVIDHIDGNKLNNAVSNLRKVTLSENVLAAIYDTKTNKTAKPVDQYDLNGNYISSYPSAAEAARQLKLDSSTITKVCRGQNRTHGGFIFKYK